MRASEAAEAEGEALLASLREGQTPSEQAQSWQVVEAATRSQDDVDPAVLQAVFRMAKPEVADKPTFAGVTLSNGDYVVVQLKGVSEPEGALSEEDKATYARFLASRNGQQDFESFRRQLQDKAEVERF